MKKFLFILFGLFVVMGAFAAGENTPTSKSYVDAAVAQKQDKISASIIMPAGYTRLEYLKSTGTQYIDTLVTLGADFEIYLDAMVSSRADHILLAGGLEVNRYNASVFKSGINGVFANGGIEFGGDNNRFYIGISPFWVMSYNGVKRVLVRGYSPSGTLKVFSGTAGRLYNLKIYSGPLLQFNGIPARRNSDNVVGMYDTISGQFFTNSGTGEFIAGPVITPGNQVLTNTGTAGEYGTKGIYDANGEYATQQNNLVDAVTMNTAVQNAIDSEFQCIEWLDPNDHTSECLLFNIFGPSPQQTIPREYTQLECIESTGTQYIDTLVTLGVDFEIYLDAMVSSRADHILLAGGLDVQKYSASLFSSGINGNWGDGGIEFGGDNNRFYIGISPFWIMHYNGVKKVVVRRYSPSGTLRVFSGTVGRLYNLKIYSGPLLQFNGIPARRNSDNVVGMYDTISGQFFTNSGTGEFIARPVVNLYLPAGN